MTKLLVVIAAIINFGVMLVQISTGENTWVDYSTCAAALGLLILVLWLTMKKKPWTGTAGCLLLAFRGVDYFIGVNDWVDIGLSIVVLVLLIASYVAAAMREEF